MTGSAGIALTTALAMVLATAHPAVAAKRHATFHTPGYTWNRKLPKVAPVIPGRLIKLGDGVYPHVIVDAAGTGQIAYTTQPLPSVNQASAARDCVLLRGQTGCAASASLVPPEDGQPFGNADDNGPTPLAIGNQLLMLSHRYPNPETLPDLSSGYPTFLWTSEDGGKSFTGPGIVGNLGVSGNAVAFGGAAPQIGVITDTMTGGTIFQATPPGAFSAARLNLGDQGPDEAYNGRLALDGDTPVAEFSDLKDHIFIREYNGIGDIMSSASWSVARIDGQGYSRIVGGPSGVWLLYQKTYSGPLFVQRIVHGTPQGAAVQVTPTTDFQHANYAIEEDAQGRLTVGYFVSTGTKAQLYVQTSPTGTSWSAPQLIARDLNQPNALALGAAPDGGGFAAFDLPEHGGLSHSQVAVAAFGSPLATGVPGLGNVGGDGLGGIGGDPLGSTSCTDVHFGDIDAIAEAGCFLRDPRNPTSGAAIIAGEIRLNGLEIVPDAKVQIVIDPKLHTINTTGAVSVVLKAPAPVGDITLYHGELHISLSGSLAGAGQTLFQIDTSQFPVSLKGFPIEGSVAVQIQHDRVVIPVSLKLPEYMGGVTGQATLLADNAHGFQLSSLHIGVDDLILGALEIKGLHIDYDGTSGSWAGGATLNIPAGSPYFAIDVQVRFDHGDFTMGSFDVSVPFPGVPIFTDAYLTGFGGGFDIHPGKRRFTGTVNVGAIPLDPPNYTIGVTGTVSLTFNDNGPVVLEADGSGSLHGFNIATAKLIFQSNGYFEVDGSVDISVLGVGITGGLSAFVDLPTKEFSSDIKGSIDVEGETVGSAEGVVSSKGIAACGTELGVSVGFSYPWGGTPDPMLGSCDTSAYVLQPPPSAARAAGGPGAHAAAVSTAADAPYEDFRVTGAGAPPSVVLTGPHGAITPVALAAGGAKAPAFFVANAATDTTYVALRKPGHGTWTVSAAPGSSAITTVAAARGYAPASVRARVSGHGARRRLGYTVTTRAGLSIAFAEAGHRAYRVLGVAHGKRGSLTFTPAPGAAGARKIYALIAQGGVPRQRRLVATYTAPAPQTPGRTAHLRIRRQGRRFAISFKTAPSAVRYIVRITASDGRHLLTLTRRHSLTVPVIGYSDRLTVSVTAVSGAGRHGAAVSAHS